MPVSFDLLKLILEFNLKLAEKQFCILIYTVKYTVGTSGYRSNGYLTVDSGVSMWASALVGAVAVLAGAAVQAGFGVALVDVMLAVDTDEARRA